MSGRTLQNRKDEVWLYPVRTTPELMRQAFVGMLSRAIRQGR